MRPLRLVAAGLLIGTTGCSTVNPIGVSQAIPTAAPSYQSGRAVQSIPTTPDLLDRSRMAMEDVGIHSIVQRKEEQATLLEGKTATGRRAVVAIQPSGANSVVTARFGAIGDEPLSRAFLDRLNARESTSPPSESRAAETVAASTPPRRPPANRAAAPPASMLQKQLEGGYRDSVAP